jgi:ferredoxin-NADP reductase
VTRDNAFHPLRVGRVIQESDDAISFVLDVPDELRGAFDYEAGQFCTFRIVAAGESHVRCYSMSSAPALGEPLQVTVKRVPGGIVSNWMIDNVSSGDVLGVARPSGFFRLTGDGPFVAFAAGSGITPILSVLKTALSCTQRDVHLLYANRDRDSVIFHDDLEKLITEHPDRLHIAHHLDVDDGFVGADAVRAVAAPLRDTGEFYVCGPTPFMDVVETSLLADGIDVARIHIERFTPAQAATAPSAVDAARVTIELDGRTEVTDHRPGTTILQTARQLAMSPPSSCEAGSCATCIGRVLEGAVSMYVNNALTPAEVEEGWILTCQSVPTTPTVHVVYGYD